MCDVITWRTFLFGLSSSEWNGSDGRYNTANYFEYPAFESGVSCQFFLSWDFQFLIAMEDLPTFLIMISTFIILSIAPVLVLLMCSLILHYMILCSQLNFPVVYIHMYVKCTASLVCMEYSILSKTSLSPLFVVL